MNSIIYIVGLVVVVLAMLLFFSFMSVFRPWKGRGLRWPQCGYGQEDDDQRDHDCDSARNDHDRRAPLSFVKRAIRHRRPNMLLG
jgi:hypothetical protein